MATSEYSTLTAVHTDSVLSSWNNTSTGACSGQVCPSLLRVGCGEVLAIVLHADAQERPSMSSDEFDELPDRTRSWWNRRRPRGAAVRAARGWWASRRVAGFVRGIESGSARGRREGPVVPGERSSVVDASTTGSTDEPVAEPAFRTIIKSSCRVQLGPKRFKCGSGGIGRRASLRSLCPQGREGSSPSSAPVISSTTYGRFPDSRCCSRDPATRRPRELSS